MSDLLSCVENSHVPLCILERAQSWSNGPPLKQNHFVSHDVHFLRFCVWSHDCSGVTGMYAVRLKIHSNRQLLSDLHVRYNMWWPGAFSANYHFSSYLHPWTPVKSRNAGFVFVFFFLSPTHKCSVFFCWLQEVWGGEIRPLHWVCSHCLSAGDICCTAPTAP